VKILGLIGGIAPGSTVDYCRALVAEYREREIGGFPLLDTTRLHVRRAIDELLG
jgi:aspartate/glutamate racemase